MLFGTDTREERDVSISLLELVQPASRSDENSEAARKADLYRKMYERIAEGNALAEAEETAQRKRPLNKPMRNVSGMFRFRAG